MNDMINDMMEDHDLLVAEADSETLREWVREWFRQALYITRSETVEAVVEKIEKRRPSEVQTVMGDLHHNCAYWEGYNDSLTDLIKEIKKDV